MSVATIPPQELRAEQAVLGCVLVEPAMLRAVADTLTAEMFYDDTARRAYAAITRLAANEAPIDITTVLAEMGATDKEATAFLGDCCQVLSVSEHAIYYARMVAAAYRDREIIRRASELAYVVNGDKVGDPKELLAKITAEVMAKDALGAPQTFEYDRDWQSIIEDMEKPREKPLLETGINAIDEIWRGMLPGEVNTWGAPTNAGKSVMLLNLCHNAAIKGTKCLYAGTEMSARETATRHLAIVSSVEAWRLRARKLQTNDAQKILAAISDRMVKLPISLLDHPYPSLEQVEAAIASSKAEVVFLDYLERFKFPKAENYRLQIGEFMKGLKTLARKRGVVIHLAAQLGRGVYNNEARRPTLADLSESSTIEKDSDRVVLMWRPEDKQKVGSTIECIQAKNRHGHKGAIFDLAVNEQTLRISEPNTEPQREFPNED